MNTYFSIANGLASVLSCMACWYIQKHYKIRAKMIFDVINVGIMLISLWGMIGIWSTKFGLRNTWEFWACNILLSVFQAPFYAFSQTIMADLVPPGYEKMFFGLYGFSNVASNIIGITIVQMIIDIRNKNRDGFTFLFCLCFVSWLVILFRVDVRKGRTEAFAWAKVQRARESISHDRKSSDDKIAPSGKFEKEMPTLIHYTPTKFGNRWRNEKQTHL